MIKLLMIIGCVILCTFLIFLFRPEWENREDSRHYPGRIPIAVLGDSDSHSFRDNYRKVRRGGDYHDVTFQWTEILERLRPQMVDLGQFGYWGTRKIVYRIRSRLSLDARMPRKQDYQYNFAISGAKCEMLSSESTQKQTYFLTKLLDKNTDYWNNGLILIRIGINDIGIWPMLERFIRDDVSAELTINNCINEIKDSVALIRNHHQTVRIVLVGIMDNSNWPLFEKVSDIEHARINTYLDIYDNGLKQLALADKNIMFVNDRRWYEELLGFWNQDGSYIGERFLNIGGGHTITNSKGDHPYNIVLNDNHAGTVANALWLQNLMSHANTHFGLGLTPLRHSEIAALIDSVDK